MSDNEKAMSKKEIIALIKKITSRTNQKEIRKALYRIAETHKQAVRTISLTPYCDSDKDGRVEEEL